MRDVFGWILVARAINGWCTFFGMRLREIPVFTTRNFSILPFLEREMHIQIREDENRDTGEPLERLFSSLISWSNDNVIEGRNFSLEMSPCALKVRWDREKSAWYGIARDRFCDGDFSRSRYRATIADISTAIILFDWTVVILAINNLIKLYIDTYREKKSHDLLFVCRSFLSSCYFRGHDERATLNFNGALNSFFKELSSIDLVK